MFNYNNLSHANQSRVIRSIAVGILMIFVICLGGSSIIYHEIFNIPYPEPQVSEIMDASNPQGELKNKRKLIEEKYPEFKDFENQKSFAGKGVSYKTIDKIYYVAYIVYGSGVPIAGADCFRVERNDVSKIYVEPSAFREFTSIDPQTCKEVS